MTIPSTDTNFRKEAAAAYLDMSLSTFNSLYKSGKIKGYRLSAKKIFFKKSDLDALLQNTQGTESHLASPNIF